MVFSWILYRYYVSLTGVVSVWSASENRVSPFASMLYTYDVIK